MLENYNRIKNDGSIPSGGGINGIKKQKLMVDPRPPVTKPMMSPGEMARARRQAGIARNQGGRNVNSVYNTY
jgi:hypothetical protein